MDYDENEAGFGVSESRYADVRAQRELRSRERDSRRRAPEPRAAKQRGEKSREDPYADIPPYENYESDYEYGEPPRGSLVRVVATQALVCAVLLGGLFFARSAMPNVFRQLKTAYTRVMQTDMSAREVWAAAARAFRRLRDDVYVAAPYKDAEAEQKATAQDDAAQTAAEEPKTTQRDDDAETTCEDIKTTCGDAVGGMDIAAAYAEKSCAFAPLLTTVRPYPPVEDGRVTSLFGYRAHPVTGEESIHTGLDIAAQPGTPIHAAFYGVVAEAGTGREYGNYIVLEHAGGLRTLYAHCAEVLAEEGMVLRAGDVIALVGSTGASTGPHVHVEMRLHGLRCDPIEVLGIRDQESGGAA